MLIESRFSSFQPTKLSSAMLNKHESKNLHSMHLMHCNTPSSSVFNAMCSFQQDSCTIQKAKCVAKRLFAYGSQYYA